VIALRLALAAGVLVAAGCAHPSRGPQPASTAAAWEVRHIERGAPRPLQIHAVRCDVFAPSYELAAAVAAPDPDGAGPAETVLVRPETIVSNAGFRVAVNANSFGRVAPRGSAVSSRDWREGEPVAILGAAVTNGVRVSSADAQFASFWIARDGRFGAGRVSEATNAWQAVAGFGPVVSAGRNLCSTNDGVCHPRTAVGVEPDGRHVWFVVADGRQAGYSEGMSLSELADLMIELGCREAVNLDGGGSTALFVADGGGPPRLVNRPSGGATRPVPVMLGLRPRSCAKPDRPPP
jgi:hypothetical protein